MKDVSFLAASGLTSPGWSVWLQLLQQWLEFHTEGNSFWSHSNANVCLSQRWQLQWYLCGTRAPGCKSLHCWTVCVQKMISENSFPGITGFIHGSFIVLRGGWDKVGISYSSHTPLVGTFCNEPWVWRSGLRTERFAGWQILQTAEKPTAN